MTTRQPSGWWSHTASLRPCRTTYFPPHGSHFIWTVLSHYGGACDAFPPPCLCLRFRPRHLSTAASGPACRLWLRRRPCRPPPELFLRLEMTLPHHHLNNTPTSKSVPPPPPSPPVLLSHYATATTVIAAAGPAGWASCVARATGHRVEFLISSRFCSLIPAGACLEYHNSPTHRNRRLPPPLPRKYSAWRGSVYIKVPGPLHLHGRFGSPHLQPETRRKNRITCESNLG
jgi:hypothetical protein